MFLFVHLFKSVFPSYLTQGARGKSRARALILAFVSLRPSRQHAERAPLTILLFHNLDEKRKIHCPAVNASTVSQHPGSVKHPVAAGSKHKSEYPEVRTPLYSLSM